MSTSHKRSSFVGPKGERVTAIMLVILFVANVGYRAGTTEALETTDSTIKFVVSVFLSAVTLLIAGVCLGRLWQRAHPED